MASTTLSYRAAVALLQRTAETYLQPMGFRKRGALGFFRPVQDGEGLINFSTRRGKNQELCFSFGVGVRFPAIERVLDQAESGPQMPTAGIPVNVLTHSTTDLEWCLSDETEAAKMLTSAMTCISEHAIRFIDRYSTMEAVADSLRSDDTSQWFVFTQEQRMATLVAIEFITGARSIAIERLNTFLSTQPDLPSKKRFPLQQLQARLTAKG